MSFSFVPWPLFLLIIIGLGTVLIIWSIKSRNDYHITFTLGVILACITAMLVGLDRAVSNINGSEYPLAKLMALFGIPVIPLFFVGAYQKTKNNPEKRKIVKIGAATCIFSIAGIIGIVILKMLE